MDDEKQGMRELEENPPKDLEDWPDDERKYETFGGREGDHSVRRGPRAQARTLRASSTTATARSPSTASRSTIPTSLKGDPIPGGPTDPDAGRPEAERNSD